MGRARQVVRYKLERGGRIIEVVIWLLDAPLPGCVHPFKYRLFYGELDGRCLVRYDNERGKGDHRHLPASEEPYRFTTLRRLIEDFETDVERS